MLYDKIKLSPMVAECVARLMNSREGLIREVKYEGADKNQLNANIVAGQVMPPNISQGSQNVKAFVAFLLVERHEQQQYQ